MVCHLCFAHLPDRQKLFLSRGFNSNSVRDACIPREIVFLLHLIVNQIPSSCPLCGGS